MCSKTPQMYGIYIFNIMCNKHMYLNYISLILTSFSRNLEWRRFEACALFYLGCWNVAFSATRLKIIFVLFKNDDYHLLSSIV